MHTPQDPTSAQLQQEFLRKGATFFGWNSGTNTGNALRQIPRSVEQLDATLQRITASVDQLHATIERASASTDRWSARLVYYTRLYTVLTAILVGTAIWQSWLANRQLAAAAEHLQPNQAHHRQHAPQQEQEQHK